jgi:hypothetical protein
VLALVVADLDEHVEEVIDLGAPTLEGLYGRRP